MALAGRFGSVAWILGSFFGESAAATSVFFFRHILSRSVGVFEEH